MSEMIYFDALVEYMILTLMLFKWTFLVLRWEALLNHFGCFIFAASGLLTLVILLSFYHGTETHSLCLWVRYYFHFPETSAYFYAGGSPFDLCRSGLAVGSTQASQLNSVGAGFSLR